MRFILLIVLTFSVSVYGQRADFEHIDFKKADSIADVYKGESLKNLPVLTHNLTAYLNTDVEKLRAVYTWVSTNIENDYSAYLRTRKKRKKLADDREAYLAWNTEFIPRVFQNLIKNKKTACTGYAYLLREMANLADIKCEIVNGYGRTPTLVLEKKSIPNHSWNAVELNGKWYLCDPTWSAGQIILEEGVPIFEPDYFDGYFLADPSLFIKNHFPLNESWTLLSETPTFITFIEGPVIYKEAFEQHIIPTAPVEMYLETIKNKEISFNVTASPYLELNNIFLVLNNGASSTIVTPGIKREQNNYVIRHAFEKPGKYDVHLQVNDTLITTYVVKVKKK